MQLTACLASNFAVRESRESISTGEAAAIEKHAKAAKAREDKESILVDCLEVFCPLEWSH